MVTDNAAAERVEEVRDLRDQIAGLQRQEQAEIVFKDTSPRPPKATVWSLKTGRPVRVPHHLLEKTLAKRDRDGSYLFTAYQDRAPQYRGGTVKCFLHAESEERALLDAIGLANVVCTKENLISDLAKRMHAEHRHSAEWALYVEARARRESEDWARRQDAQT